MSRSYFADGPAEGEALLYAILAGLAVWLGSYLWKQYNKENTPRPPLDDFISKNEKPTDKKNDEE